MPKCPVCGSEVGDPTITALYECENPECGHAFEKNYDPDIDIGYQIGEVVKEVKLDLDNYAKLKELVHQAYFTKNSGVKMNGLVRQMHEITHPDHWSHTSDETGEE